MAVSFNEYTQPRWLRYNTTPSALGLSASGPLTILGWVNISELFLGDGIVSANADDGAQDSFSITRQLSDRFTSEMIVNFVFANAFVTGISINTWYFVECFFSSAERSIRVNNGTPGTNATALGTITPFTTIEIRIGRGATAQFFGCLAEIAYLNRALTDPERVSLAAGNTPPNVLGLNNIAFYNSLLNDTTMTQAYLYGAPVTMDIPNLSPITCGSSPPLIFSSSSPKASVRWI